MNAPPHAVANEAGRQDAPRFAAIVLAAGQSRRAGPDLNKLLAEVGGKALALHAVEATLESGCNPVVVVVGHEAERVERALDVGDARLHFVFNDAYADGMGTSIACGARTIGGEPALDGVFVLPSDLPELRALHFVALSRAFLALPKKERSQSIVRPVHQGVPGHPVLFGSDHLEALCGIGGDRGAREVIARHAQSLAEVPDLGAATIRDLDDPRAADFE